MNKTTQTEMITRRAELVARVRRLNRAINLAGHESVKGMPEEVLAILGEEVAALNAEIDTLTYRRTASGTRITLNLTTDPFSAEILKGTTDDGREAYTIGTGWAIVTGKTADGATTHDFHTAGGSVLDNLDIRELTDRAKVWI